jgi:hypothetical protein
MSNNSGVHFSTFNAMPSMIYSLDLPSDDDERGYTERIVSNKTLVSFYEFVISALSCKPNASGAGFSGNDSM